MSQPERVLVLGAHGLIGAAIVRRLMDAGCHVVGLKRRPPGDGPAEVDWVFGDLREMVTPERWAPVLDGLTHVVNAAGALQDGGKDDLQAVHVDAPRAMAEVAAEGGISVIQISAAGVAVDASTAFFRTKAEGDAAVLASGAVATVLRPSLVIAPDSYGGTALVRALASFPAVQPVALADASVQTVDVADVADAVLDAVRGDLAPGTYDLTSPEEHRLEDVVLATRRWLGASAPKMVWRVPGWALGPIGRVADKLGLFGWRSPVRTTALRVLQDGVRGDPAAYAAASSREPRSFEATLARYPATGADLVAARMALLLPILIGVLSAFWIVSGVIGILRIGTAAEVLTRVDWLPAPAMLSVLVFSLVDIALGVAILIRPWARLACIGMVAVSLVYLVSATLFTPHLWVDPLGPLVKVFPAMAATLVTLALLGGRR